MHGRSDQPPHITASSSHIPREFPRLKEHELDIARYRRKNDVKVLPDRTTLPHVARTSTSPCESQRTTESTIGPPHWCASPAASSQLPKYISCIAAARKTHQLPRRSSPHSTSAASQPLPLHQQPRSCSIHQRPRSRSLHQQPRSCSLHQRPRSCSLN